MKIGRSVIIFVLFISACRNDSNPIECYSDDDCYDDIGCTDDLCEWNVCNNYEFDEDCPSGFLCDMFMGCVPDETYLIVCNDDAECLDSVGCTLDSCEQGICTHFDRGVCGENYYCDIVTDCQLINPTADRDEDGVYDAYDNCWDVYNPSQLDQDRDGLGNECDCDADNDWADSIECLGDDCDDLDIYIHPDAIEWCGDWTDNDCDGLIDANDYCE